MSVASGLIQGYNPVVYRSFAVATPPGDLTARSGCPKRCAAFITFENATAGGAAATFNGPDGIAVTATIPAGSTYPLTGNFASLTALGAGISAVVGWLDDGTVQLNP